MELHIKQLVWCCQAACTLVKTSTYLPNGLNYVTKYNSKLTWIFMFHSTRNFVNYSEDKGDFFLRNNGFNLLEYSYDPGDHRKKINIPSHRSVLFDNWIAQCGNFVFKCYWTAVDWFPFRVQFVNAVIWTVKCLCCWAWNLTAII